MIQVAVGAALPHSIESVLGVIAIQTNRARTSMRLSVEEAEDLELDLIEYCMAVLLGRLDRSRPSVQQWRYVHRSLAGRALRWARDYRHPMSSTRRDKGESVPFPVSLDELQERDSSTYDPPARDDVEGVVIQGLEMKRAVHQLSKTERRALTNYLHLPYRVMSEQMSLRRAKHKLQAALGLV